MTTIRLETTLGAPIEVVWEALQRPETLRHVARPILHFQPLSPEAFPDRWTEDTFLARLWLFGLLPLGAQRIVVSMPATTGDRRVLRDDGHGRMARRWEHVITLTAEGRATRYVDEVTVEAGLLTPFVAAFARAFYAHRQRRWRRLVTGSGP